MSDTLREALEELAANWTSNANELAAGNTGLAASISAEAFITAATRLRAILAAHPGTGAEPGTDTEWGVRTNGGIEGPYAETVARMYVKESTGWNGWDEPGTLVSRRVTEWRAS